MRLRCAGSRPSRWTGLLLAVALLMTGCASTPPRPGQGTRLGYTPQAATAPASMEPDAPHLPHHRKAPHQAAPREAPPHDGAEALAGAEQRATQTRQAVLDAVEDVRRSTGGFSRSLSKLATRPRGIDNRGLSGFNDAFTPSIDYGANQLPWLHGALGGVTTLADVASRITDPDMQVGLLRMTGPRLQAALSGAMLLATWLDFLTLADAVLRQCPSYSAERLVLDLHRMRRLMEPTLAALASLEPERVEAAATAMPKLMEQLTREFGSIRDGARATLERSGQLMAAVQLFELLVMRSALKLSLPRLPPAAPATLGAGLVMGSGGVMAGSQVVVSAEWVEMIRRLVQAGVLSVPAVSAAVRIHGGQVMMAHGDLPKGVRDALGDGPEVRGMHQTGKAGAGMAEPPRHHVLPQEHRAWFEQRGFTGTLDIDQFCVRLESASHQAIHGGGNWRLGRMWPDEWNQMIMRALTTAEKEAGRMLTRDEVLKVVARNMRNYKVPMSFVPGRRR